MGFSPVWLYVPNLIGYIRILTAFAAFTHTHTPGTFFALYFISYSLDALDGVAARKLRQTSRFGAVLDMITDRFCTACLLAVLARLHTHTHTHLRGETAHVYTGDLLGVPMESWFYFLLILDVVSHWAQMYSSLAIGASSHKSLADEPPLLRFYYTFPYALFAVCMFNESFLACVYLHAQPAQAAADAAVSWIAPMYTRVTVLHDLGITDSALPLYQLIMYVSFPVFLLKQLFSVLQLGKAALRIVALDDSDRAAAAAKR